MGRGQTRAERLELDCLLASAVGVLEPITKQSPAEARKKETYTEAEKVRVNVATDIFKKLAPSSLNIGGQPNNPLGVTLQIVLNEDRTDEKTDKSI
jgi:hypothetical protein